MKANENFETVLFVEQTNAKNFDRYSISPSVFFGNRDTVSQSNSMTDT